jgi:cell division transport system permease protein
MSFGVSTRPPADPLTRRAGRSPRWWPAGGPPVLVDAAAGLRRNGLMVAAAVTTIAIALSVAGAGFLASANLAHVAAILESQVEVVGFLRRDLTAAQQQQVLAAVGAIPSVRHAEIVSRAEALQRLQQTFHSAGSMSTLLPSNPLPDSIEVRVTSAGDVRTVAEALRRVRGVDEVAYGAPVVERLISLTRAVRLVGVLIAGLLAAAALLIIVNTIRLTIAARRAEIEIMTLVGATPSFVRGPFLLEGVLQGLGAALLATIVLVGGYVVLAGQASASLPFLPLLAPRAVLPVTLLLVWGLGIVVGIGGSEIGLRRHLAL